MKKGCLFIATIIFLSLGWLSQAQAHCQIPCGIYGDEVRFYLLDEYIVTIEKSMNMIVELSGEADKNYNQLVRWIDNKETHAEYFQEIISQYFMTQRVKPAEPEDEHYRDYVEKITLLHQLLIEAMKAKQTTDVAVTKELTSLLSRFRKAYFGVLPGAHRPPQEKQ
jgi:nickel superoxide dismutase